MSTSLTSGNSIWLDVDHAGLGTEGKIAPVLVISLRLRTPSVAVEVLAQRMAGTLVFAGEPLAVFEFPPVVVHHQDTIVQAKGPFSARALTFVAAHARGEELSFELELRGLLRVMRRAVETTLIKPDVAVGEWADVVTQVARMPFTVARSTWYSSIASQLSDTSFVSVEIAIPRAARDVLSASLARLRDAEKAYALGDDVSVFAHCRGAIEAAPGFPGATFANVVNDRKRSSLEAMLKSTGMFLHSGRHVSAGPADSGAFPVDHRDALLALNLTRLLLVHISQGG